MRPAPIIVLLAACGGAAEPAKPTPVVGPPAAAPRYAVTRIALPGGGADGVGMDYLLFDPRTNAVWVPAGNTGAVDVIDVATQKVEQITGFATREFEREGHKRMVGPSSAALGPAGTVYVGSRGDASVCAFDEVTRAKKTCVTLDSSPDGLQFVAATRELWVTTPRDKTIRILDGVTLDETAKLPFEGNPEGFAIDAARHRFYTNLEDKDVTLAIDAASHATVATWHPACGEEGPHGLVYDDADGLLLVACDAKVVAIDVETGAIAGTLAASEGLDAIDYLPATRTVYAGGGEAGTLTIATLDPKGALALVAQPATDKGARNGVVTATGAVYLSHGRGSEILVVAPERESR